MRAVLTPVLVVAMGCGSQVPSATQVSKVQQARDAFFAAISAYDSAAIRARAVADYVLVEDGAIWNVDSLNQAVMHLKNGGLEIGYTFSDDSVRFEGPLAWMTYRNRGILSGPAGADTLHWVESALFRKEAGEWRMVLLHSTRVRR